MSKGRCPGGLVRGAGVRGTVVQGAGVQEQVSGVECPDSVLRAWSSVSTQCQAAGTTCT